MAKVDTESSDRGCWLWTASRKGKRYGQFKIGSRMAVSHRVSYELHIGPIPDGMNVLHRCDDVLCVNPDHLFIGTQIDNMRDMAVKERSRATRLTAADVLTIRSEYANGITQRQLARRFNCTDGNIARIVRRLNWKHIP